MANAGIPHPYTAPANPVTFSNTVATKDPLGFVRADNGGASPFAQKSALLYNHHNGTVHEGLIGLIQGGAFGEGVNHVQYRHSGSVTVDETTPVDITALPPRLLFGAVNTHDGYLSRHNDMSIVFPVLVFPNQMNKIIWQQRIYKDHVLPPATLRSLVPNMKNTQDSIEFYLQQVGGGVDITIESIAHGAPELVKDEILRRIHQLELSLAKTMNVFMTNALATSPTLICRWLMQSWTEADGILKGTHPNPSRWVNQVLTRQLTSFCPSQLRNVSKRHPIRDLVKSLNLTSSEEDQRPIFLVTTSTVAEMLMESNKTLSLPETERVFYLKGDGNSKTFQPLQSFPGAVMRGPSELPFIQVDGQKLAILKVPDLPNENGKNTSSFINLVTGMFVVPIGYALRHVPEVSKFREVDFNAVCMTVFDNGGEDGEMQWHRDILCRSGLNDAALFDPHEYDKMMLSLEGGEAAATAFKECFKDQDTYDARVFSATGITPRDREFNLCVSNHVLYVGRSFGRTIPKDSTFAGNDPNSRFRATGIDGNRPLCTATGYLQAARSAIANMHDMNKDAENVFRPFLEACLRIPFDTNKQTGIKEDFETTDKELLAWLTRIRNFDTFLIKGLQDFENMDHQLLHILKSVFLGSGVSKWMNVPRVLFSVLEAANLGVLTPSVHTKLEEAFGIGSVLDVSKFQETVERLRDVHSAIGSFCRDAMASFAVDDTNINAYIFYELPTVVPVAIISGDNGPDKCDRDTPRAKLWTRRMFLETVMNLLATHLYAAKAIAETDKTYIEYEYTFQVQVHNMQKRCERYKQPYFLGGFYSTHEYDEELKTSLELLDATPYHPLLSCRPSADAGERRRHNFYHSHVSRHFSDLRQMYGVPLGERVVAALACLRPHTPANALAIPPHVQTHTAAHIVRYGTFETHRLVALRTGDRDNMYNGFIACATPVLTHRKSSNGGMAFNVFMQTAPVLPNKANSTIQLPHYFCRGCKKGMGHRMANIQWCLDKKLQLPEKVFEEEAFAIPVPSCFSDDPFGVPFFPIDGAYGPSFLQDMTRCDRPDPLHTAEGAYSYNPMTRANAPSEILVLNKRLREASAGRVQLPPWSTSVRRSPTSHTGLKQRLAKMTVLTKEGMKPDAQWGAETVDNHLNITPEDRMCMFDRFYHPGPKGHEYGKKSRSILGENSNSSLNWTQTLETHRRLLNQPIAPLDRHGCERLISDVPLSNGFVY